MGGAFADVQPFEFVSVFEGFLLIIFEIAQFDGESVFGHIGCAQFDCAADREDLGEFERREPGAVRRFDDVLFGFEGFDSCRQDVGVGNHADGFVFFGQFDVFFDGVGGFGGDLGHELGVDEFEVDVGDFVADVEGFGAAFGFDVFDGHFGEFRPVINFEERGEGHRDLGADGEGKLVFEAHRFGDCIHQRGGNRLGCGLDRRAGVREQSSQHGVGGELFFGFADGGAHLLLHIFFIDDFEVGSVGKPERGSVGGNLRPPIGFDGLDLVFGRLGSGIELRPSF